MRSKVVLDSPRLRELRNQRRKKFQRKMLIVFSLLAAVFIGLGFLARIDDLKIKAVSVTGNKIVDTKSLEDFTWSILNGYYVWLYPKSNVMIYPNRELETRIKDQFKRIESMSLSVDTDRNLKIDVTERGARYVWCDINMKCYFTDDFGYVFDEAPYFSGPVYLKFLGGIDINQSPLGQTVAGASFVDLASFAETVKSFGIPISSLNLKADAEAEISVATSGIEEPKIIFNPKGDLPKIAGNLKTAIESEPLQTDLATKPEELLYIDLRFDNKVYFKFK